MDKNVLNHVSRTIRQISRNEIGTRYKRLAQVSLFISMQRTKGLHGAARRKEMHAIYFAVWTKLNGVPSKWIRNYPNAYAVGCGAAV